MQKPSLRLFSSSTPDPTRSDETAARTQRELDRMAGAAVPKTVSVSLGTMVPLLLDAATNDRAWLADFADDTIRMDADLYDVLLAYSQMSRGAAA